MNKPTITIIRGLPGSGKTTKAVQICIEVGTATVSADDFFVGMDGIYRFNPAKLPEAHATCQASTRSLLERGKDVIVHNTFTQGWEATPYVEMARGFGASIAVFDLFDSGLTDEDLFKRNVHGVPLDSIKAMRARWDADLLEAQRIKPGR